MCNMIWWFLFHISGIVRIVNMRRQFLDKNSMMFHNEEDKLKEILIIDQLTDRAVDE